MKNFYTNLKNALISQFVVVIFLLIPNFAHAYTFTFKNNIDHGVTLTVEVGGVPFKKLASTKKIIIDPGEEKSVKFTGLKAGLCISGIKATVNDPSKPEGEKVRTYFANLCGSFKYEIVKRDIKDLRTGQDKYEYLLATDRDIDRLEKGLGHTSD